jgi:5'-methylthioadenosine phosphorylase
VNAPVSVAVIGGSGLYRLFDAAGSEVRQVATPYGPVELTVGSFGGRPTAFLPRHGSGHTVAPHLIDARANIWALASLGVRAVLTTAAVGGLHPDYPPGTLALTDQLIDRTSGRADTFYDRGSVQHLPAADPFDPGLHRIGLGALGDDVRPAATMVVIQGPRFSTRAESQWFAGAGAHLVNMTLYPEVVLAAELNLGYLNLAYVTDTDAGLTDEPLTADLVFSRLAEAQPRLIAALEGVAAAIPSDYLPRVSIAPAEVAAVLARDVV